jgi:hypothetical protein
MAITIEQTPDTFSPVYNPIIFVVSSDNTSESNFSYIFDLYYDGTLQTRHRMPANPSNGLGKIDVRRILESQITHDIEVSTSGWAQNTNSYKKFYIKFGEEYDVSGVTTVDADLETSADFYAYNSVFEYLDFIDYTSGNYLLAATSDKFLTNSPDQYFNTGNRAWLYLINNDPTTVSKARFKKYNSSGTLLDTQDVNNSSYNTNTDSNRFLRIGVGPWNVSQTINGTWLDNASYYTVEVLNGSNTRISEIKTFYIQDTCKYTPIRLHWLNKLGGFDSFNFSLINRKSSTIEKSFYNKPAGSFSGSSFSFSKSDRSQNALNITYEDSVLINSDWLTDQEAIWLKELVTSPVVFQELNSVLIPVTIQDTKYEEKERISSSLFNLQITFNYSNKNNRQRY